MSDGLRDGLGGLGNRAGTGAWLPVTVISQMDADPTEMQIAGDTYVVWRDPLKARKGVEGVPFNQGWSVMRDECPHRRAPLSQGRVDPATGNIECAYHGWQFDTAGTCTAIPQKNAALKCETVQSAQALPTHITGDILWAYFPLPGVWFPSLLDGTPSLANFKSRELPYNWDFLVENFMDPAQYLLTSKDNNTHCEVAFKDKSRGKTRSGVVSFIAPCYYHARVKKEGESDFKIGLLGFVVPTCRLIFSAATPLPSLLRKVIPTWPDHAISNRFLDSDLWLHEAERRVRGPGNAFYSTGAATGTGTATGTVAVSAAVPVPVPANQCRKQQQRNQQWQQQWQQQQ
ncbi:Rieske [2Fe-2S] iron-sulfur domain-containing protein [Ochromonadaceae sp. CCMP2298]|nr:Rieske [2Fe-2S] iron-sulfur domain-containing protein [Ochromonadaceae sp. CCMP2298]